jgi:hypothetical protein
MPTLVKEIEDMLRQTEVLWDTQKYGDLIKLWDPNEETPFYLAEEEDDWKIGWDELKKYWEPVPGKRKAAAIRMRFSNVRAKMIAPDLAYGTFEIRFDMKLYGPMKAFGETGRGSAIFRKTSEGWRYISYAESPLAPLKYMQTLYEKNLHPEFNDFHDNIMEREAKDKT